MNSCQQHCLQRYYFAFLKPLLFIFLLCLSNGEEIHGQDQNEIDLSQSRWIMLSQVDGEWVIYHYCFAGIGSITFGPSENGGFKLLVFSGQDSEIFDVVNMSRADDAIVLRIKNRYGEQERDIFFRYVDADVRLGIWEGLYPGFPAIRSVLSEYESEMRHINENNGDCEQGQ